MVNSAYPGDPELGGGAPAGEVNVGEGLGEAKGSSSACSQAPGSCEAGLGSGEEWDWSGDVIQVADALVGEGLNKSSLVGEASGLEVAGDLPGVAESVQAASECGGEGAISGGSAVAGEGAGGVEAAGEPILVLEDASLAQSDQVVLRGVNLTMRAGDFYYLVGRVGSGKTTLITTLTGELALRGGRGWVCGYDLGRLRCRDVPYLRRKLGVVFQDFKLLTDRSVEGNLHFALRATGWRDRVAISRRMEEVLDLVGLRHKAYKMPSQLSGGEQQRVTIARALLNDPPLILADEPTGNLDPETSSGIVTLLHDLAAQGRAVIMATHNHSMVTRYPAPVYQCLDGALVQMDSAYDLSGLVASGLEF